MENIEQITFNRYFYCGTQSDYLATLRKLANLAENEPWTYEGGTEYGILKNYLTGTLRRCIKQSKFEYSGDYCCFNTGLLTPNGNDIIALAKSNKEYKSKNSDAQDWLLKSFVDITDRQYMYIFPEVPPLITYTEDYTDFNFNPNLRLVINSDHILDDNWERISAVVPLPKNIVKTLVIGAVEEVKKKIMRNTRLAVPQFYKERVMFLLPISLPLDEEKNVTMALAVEKTENNQYRANTIFTKEMAYEKARLVMKPESNWLI